MRVNWFIGCPFVQLNLRIDDIFERHVADALPEVTTNHPSGFDDFIFSAFGVFPCRVLGSKAGASQQPDSPVKVVDVDSVLVAVVGDMIVDCDDV